MARRKMSLVLLLLLVSWGGLPTGAQTPATELLSTLSGRDELGVDRTGHVWGWQAAKGRVEVYSPRGELESIVAVQQVYRLDVDAVWGVASLERGGRVLQGRAINGEPRFRIPFEEPMGDVVWIDAHHVAVAPTRSSHRVEIWNLDAQARVRVLGEAVPIEPRPGAQFSRAIDLAFDPSRRNLWALESRTGELQVLTLAGKLLSEARIDNPRLGEFDEWLRGVDRSMKEKGESHLQGLRYFHLTLDAEGNAWIVQRCKEGVADLVRVSPGGDLRNREINVACCATKSLTTRHRLLLHRQPSLPGGACLQVTQVLFTGESP